MPTGTVKWFNNTKGYGFILEQTTGEDVFAHYSCIQMDGYKTLRAGQHVSFEIERGQKGLLAKNIMSPESEVYEKSFSDAPSVSIQEHELSMA